MAGVLDPVEQYDVVDVTPAHQYGRIGRGVGRMAHVHQDVARVARAIIMRAFFMRMQLYHLATYRGGALWGYDAPSPTG